jgi:hypothetical protein
VKSCQTSIDHSYRLLQNTSDNIISVKDSLASIIANEIQVSKKSIQAYNISCPTNLIHSSELKLIGL